MLHRDLPLLGSTQLYKKWTSVSSAVWTKRHGSASGVSVSVTALLQLAPGEHKMAPLTLYYFSIPGRAEVARLMLTIGKIDFVVGTTFVRLWLQQTNCM